MSNVIPFSQTRTGSTTRRQYPLRALPTSTVFAEIVLNAYFSNRRSAATAAYDHLGIPRTVCCNRLHAAVGFVLLGWWTQRNDAPRTAAVGRVISLPQHLFSIDWAPMPGSDWPEEYHLVYVPAHDRYVVITSQPPCEIRGNTCQAIGHFDNRDLLLCGVKRVVCRYWQRVRDRECMTGQWLFFERAGSVSEACVRTWASRIWLW